MERGRGRKILKNQRGADPGLEVIPLKCVNYPLELDNTQTPNRAFRLAYFLRQSGTERAT